MTHVPPKPSHRGWTRKFADAFRGIGAGVVGQTSFRVHFPIAVAVIACAAFFRLDTPRWCVLLLAIGTVLTAELFNSAIEQLAQAITEEHDERIGRALDIASGAVLAMSIAAALVGSVVFVEALFQRF